MSIIRTIFFFIGFIIFYRILGGRVLGQIGIADLAIVVVIGSLLVPLLTGGNTSPENLLTIILTLLLFSRFIRYIAYICPNIDTLTDGKPTPIILEGEIYRRNARKLLITDADIARLLRESGVYDIKIVKRALIETDGSFTVEKYPEFTALTVDGFCHPDCDQSSDD